MSLNKRTFGICLLLLHFFHVVPVLNAQEGTGGIFIAGKTGISYLATEIHSNFSGAVSESGNLPGPYAGLELSVYAHPALEAGAGFSYSFLRGNTANPDFSAIGYQYYMTDAIQGPVVYTNRLLGPELFARWYPVRNRRPGGMNLFLKAGVGVMFHESQISYLSSAGEEISFGKNKGDFKQYNLTNVAYILGTGLRYSISDRIGLKLAANFNFVGYDFLDVVHNFDAEGQRAGIIGLYTDLTAGISIRLEKPAVSETNKVIKSARAMHLPFSPQ
jgi:hypothetical protein